MRRIIAAGSICIGLSGCGGGGGDSDNSPSLTPLATSISITAPVNQAQAPTSTLNFTLDNVSESEGYYFSARYTNSGIGSLGQNFPDFRHPGLNIDFRPPYTLSPGTYTDTVQVRLCSDSGCTKPLTNIQTFQVTYTVTAAIGSAAPTATLSAHQVNFSAFLTDYRTLFPRPPSIDVSFDNFPISPKVTVTSTQRGIESAYFGFTGEVALSMGQVGIYLKTPGNLGPGTYSDIITLRICLDENCRNPLPPQTISVEYIVTNTVDGAGGYMINAFNIKAADMVWDSARGQFVIALSESASVNPNTIATLDPVSGAVQPTIVLTASPSALAISDDRQYLYVGFSNSNLIQRYLLSSMTLDLSIHLQNYYFNSGSFTRQIKVAPGAPQTIAVAMQDLSGNPLGAVVFDNAVPRPMTFGFLDVIPADFVHFIEWGADASMLYGCGSSNATGAELYVLDVDSTGLHLASRIPAAAGTRMHFANGLLYEDAGAVFDPYSQSLQASFGLSLENVFMTPDVALERAFFVTLQNQTDGSRAATLKAYNLTSRALISSLPLPGNFTVPGRLIRWGTDGLAYIDGLADKIVIVNGKFVAP